MYSIVKGLGATVVVLVVVTGGYLTYQRRVALPPVHLVSGGNLGQQLAGVPIQADFTLRNASRRPLELVGLTNY